MTDLRTATRETILAVDTGATTIKFGVVDPEGQLVDEVLRMATPYPCSPSRLVEFISEQISLSGCSRIGVGFPGDLREGLVIEPGNLSRPEGFTSDIDPLLLAEWQTSTSNRRFAVRVTKASA
ncbi:MAG TPA: hypothetical protein VII60_07795 [Acidimicrobiales bacterium]